MYDDDNTPTALSYPTPLTNLDPNINPTNISISPAFYPGAFDEISDTVLLSSDSVLFYINSATTTMTQPNAFRRLLGIPLTDAGCRDHIIVIDETSNILPVMLHALYDTPCSPVPSLDSIVTAIDKMRMYEISPAIQLTPASQLYRLVLSFAPVQPLDVYALAGFHKLNEMAVEASSHLASFPLSNVTDEIATRIGASYLLRLFQWKLHRSSELRRIFLKPLFPHPPTRECSLEQRRVLDHIWAAVLAELGSEVIADLTLALVRSLLDPHLEKIACELCKGVVEKRIRDVIVEWNGVPRTISPAVGATG